MKKVDLKCAHCGHVWQDDADEAAKTMKAAKSNKQGPWCSLCFHIKWAVIYAQHQNKPNCAAFLERALEFLAK